MPLFEIRPIEKQELDELSRLATDSFIESFRDIDPLEELVEYSKNHYSAAAFSAAKDDPKQRLFGLFLPENDGEMAGFVQLELEKNEKGERPATDCHLRRIYLLRKFIGQKLGAALMKKAIDAAREHGCRRLWLVVYYQNFAAQDFYRRFGMREAGIFEFDFNGTIHLDPIFELEI